VQSAQFNPQHNINKFAPKYLDFKNQLSSVANDKAISGKIYGPDSEKKNLNSRVKRCQFETTSKLKDGVFLKSKNQNTLGK
jgi:hypothetical protein